MLKASCYLFFCDELIIIDKDELPQIRSLILRQIELENKALAIELRIKPPYLQKKFLPLRQALCGLSEKQLLQTIRAYFLLRWDNIHQFCGACGRQTTLNPPAFERICTNCSLSFFPRISPCIIVRITKGQKILMARSPHFAPGVYGLIAGFVEAGETVEQAVHREVMEETGLKIKNLDYFSSQPWPFPDALMLGFTAEYKSGQLQPDPNELEDAGWFNYNQLPGRPSNSLSMASQLIDDFIQKQAE